MSDTLDPRSAAAAGVQLTNLLWVRFSDTQEARASSAQPNQSVMPKRHDLGDRSTEHHGIRHPRTETKGIDRALEKMLIQKAETRLKKMEGTPGFPNQNLSLAAASRSKLPSSIQRRRADASDPLRQIDRRAADFAHEWARERAHVPAVVQGGLKRETKPWSKLDKALRTADQILQAGGFRVVVLDLASVTPEQALRIPSATWYRFSRAAQEGDAILLLLTQEPCARSSANACSTVHPA